MKTNKHVRTLVRVNKRLKIMILYFTTAYVLKATYVYFFQPDSIDINLTRTDTQVLIQKPKLFD